MGLFAHKRDLDWSSVPWSPGSSFAGSPRALRLVPVYAAVSQIADMFSMLPQSRTRGEGGARKSLDLPGWLLRPDPRIDAFAWRYQFVTSLKLRGNAYGFVLGSGSNPLGVRWLHPDAVSVDETDPDGPRYIINGHSKAQTRYAQGGQIVHVAEFVQPGSVKGLSPIAQFKQVFETATYAMGYGHDWFEKSSLPAALLTAKSRLKPGEAAEAKKLFRDSVADGGPVTLDADWDYKALSVAPNEAQFLETIKASATLIANIFRVPPEDIGGEVGSSRSYGNREADAERFNVRTMRPLAARYEQAMTDLLPAAEYITLDLSVLSRPSQLDQARTDSERLRNGTRTLSELRAGDDYPSLTQEQIDEWQQWYATTHSASASDATSLALSVSDELAKQIALSKESA